MQCTCIVFPVMKLTVVTEKVFYVPSIYPSVNSLRLSIQSVFLVVYSSIPFVRCLSVRLSIRSVFPFVQFILSFIQSVGQFILFFHQFHLSSPSFCPSSISLLLYVLPVCQSVRLALRLISTDAFSATHVNARQDKKC